MFSWRRKCLELDQEGFRKLLEKLTTPSLLSISLFGNSNFESSQEGFVRLHTVLWRCGRYSEYIEAPVLHCNCTVIWRRVMLEGKQGFTGYDRKTFSNRLPDNGIYVSYFYCANIILWYRPRVMISQFQKHQSSFHTSLSVRYAEHWTKGTRRHFDNALATQWLYRSSILDYKDLKLFPETKGLASFTQLVKVRGGNLVLALPSIRFWWNFYQIISGTKYE